MVNRKELNPDASPQAALGARLRLERDRRGWKQHELGAMMGYSPTQISHVETGRKIATLSFCRRADAALGLSGTADAFERQWADMKHGALLEGFPEYVGYEGRAVEIRLYEIGIIPGLLQTPEYARVLVDSAVLRGSITPEQADERVTFLIERQAAPARGRAPMMFVVMDESCIRRHVGGNEVMGPQLDRLVQFASRPDTLLQVAPFGMGERRPFNLPVNLLTLPDLSMVAYAESQTQGRLDRETTAVLPLLTAYHQLQAASLPQAASVDMVNEVGKGTP